MAYRKTRPHPQTGQQQKGTVLEIVDSTEPVTRLKLEDGTLVRLKISVVEIMLMDDPGPDGKPAYELNANLAANFVSPGEQLDD